MIVIDASAALELLLRTPVAERIADRIFTTGETVHAPHLLDLEVSQVLRRYCLSNEVEADRAAEALNDFADMRIERHPHLLLLPRIWELRHNVTAYDAAYVALAEALDAPLLTRDARLAGSSSHSAVIELV